MRREIPISYCERQLPVDNLMEYFTCSFMTHRDLLCDDSICESTQYRYVFVLVHDSERRT